MLRSPAGICSSSSHPPPCTTPTSTARATEPEGMLHQPTAHPITSLSPSYSSPLFSHTVAQSTTLPFNKTLPDEIWVMILTHLPMKVLYQVERTCRSWYSRFIPAAKYTKIVTGACRLTLLTHVWLEADSDDEEDGELDSEEQASKSICTELYGNCDGDRDGDDVEMDNQGCGEGQNLPPLENQPPTPSPRPPPSPRSPHPCRPLRHATTAVPLICDGVHTFSRTAVFRSPKQLILPELETNCELIRFELQFSEWPLNDRVRQKVTEFCREEDDDKEDDDTQRDNQEQAKDVEGKVQDNNNIHHNRREHSLALFYASPSVSASKPSMPIRLSTTTASRNFIHRQMDEVVKYFSKARIHKCHRRPLEHCWRAGDAGQSLSSYEVVVVGGGQDEEEHSESDDDSDQTDESDDDNSIDEDNVSGRPVQRRHEHHIFPGLPSSSQPLNGGFSGQHPCHPIGPSIPSPRESPQRPAQSTRKDKRSCRPDVQEPQALLVYTSEDIPQDDYDAETHVPILDPQKDLLTYDADLTWRDAQRASEIWVYITASFIASGYYGPKGPRLSDHAECPDPKSSAASSGESTPTVRCFDHETIQQIQQDHQYLRQQEQQQHRHSLFLNQSSRQPAAAALHPAIEGLRQRYEKCRLKSIECKSRNQPRTPSSSPPPCSLGSLPVLPSAAVIQPTQSPFPPTPFSDASPTGLSTSEVAPTNLQLSFHTAQPSTPACSQQTLLRIAVIHEFRERITLLQQIVEEESLPWDPQYLQDMRVLRWVASRDTWLTRDDAITDRENAIATIRRLVKQQGQQNQPLVSTIDLEHCSKYS